MIGLSSCIRLSYQQLTRVLKHPRYLGCFPASIGRNLPCRPLQRDTHTDCHASRIVHDRLFFRKIFDRILSYGNFSKRNFGFCRNWKVPFGRSLVSIANLATVVIAVGGYILWEMVLIYLNFWLKGNKRKNSSQNIDIVALRSK